MATIIPFDAASRHAAASQPPYPSPSIATDRLVVIRKVFVNGLKNRDGTPLSFAERLEAFDQMIASQPWQKAFGDLREVYARIPFNGIPLKRAKIHSFHLSEGAI